MANLCKPITAYDFHVRYTNRTCPMYGLLHLIKITVLANLQNSRSELSNHFAARKPNHLDIPAKSPFTLPDPLPAGPGVA